MMLQDARHYDAARRLLLEARERYRNAKNAGGEAWALTWLGADALYRDPAGAETKALYEEALSRYRESNVPAGSGAILAILAQIALHAEDDALARQRAQEAVQLGRSTHIGQNVAMGLRVLAILDSRAGDFDSSDRRLAETIAIQEAAGARGLLIMSHATAAELAASRGDLSRARSHLAKGADLAREMPSSQPALELVLSAAYVAYVDGCADDAAVLFGARLGLDALTFPKSFRPIVEALEQQGLNDEVAAGANLGADEALERVIQLTSPSPSAPA
jgi:hypothetical protein